MRKKYVTIKDIARELGISFSTVSRALSDRWDINPETRRLVLETAEQMHYVPNPMALRLQNRRSKTVGVVVPEFQNSFFPQVIMGIQSVMDEAGFQLLITQSNESAQTEARNLHLLENNMVEGIMLSMTREGGNLDLYRNLQNNGIPLVFFNRTSELIDAPRVIIDDYRMARVAVEHLIETGYRRIAHLAGPKNIILSKERMNGYRDALVAAGMEVDSKLIMEAGVIQERGYEAMNQLLDSGVTPDAVFAFNDPSAIGAILAIKERGLSIPEDIAMVGFSESRSAKLIDPPLTSVAQPTFEMGEVVARLMLKKIEGTDNKSPACQTVCLNATLHVRASSRKKDKQDPGTICTAKQT